MTVNPKREEIAQEQRYFDNAAHHRQRQLDELAGAANAAANPAAAVHLKKAFGGKTQDPNEAVAVGRIDTARESLYIGRRLITDDSHRVLVISWQAKAAEPYYKASREDPLGVSRKRTYETTGNTILTFSDVVFAEAEETDEFLLRVLGQARTGTLRDIVATIQAAQFDVIRQPLDRVLIIEGGPGTGKTAIALHRVSWLLHHHRSLADGGVLVVGPHPTFMHYIRDVLPGLGDDKVELRDLRQLAPEVRRGRSEPADVARLKGDARTGELLARALDARIGVPEPVERLQTDGRFVSIPGADIAAILAESRERRLPYLARRDVFREQLRGLLDDRARGQQLRPASVRNLLERLWPQQTPAAFLRDLYGSRARLAAAAKGELDDAELGLLYRRGSDRLSEEVWSDADLPLLDELDDLINGIDRRYGHVVVDEAQDLSPMQLRSLARRSKTGSMTVVGDLAQSTGPWASDNWAEVTHHLPAAVPVQVEALRYGYRVPRQTYEFAARLLPLAAPEAVAPQTVRDGPEPTVHRTQLTERAGQAVAVATAHARESRFVGIICPARCRREIEEALAAANVEWTNADRGELGAAINLVSPQEAKGLEFDAVVVVEPEHIVAEHLRGHRMLYVALTRTTGHLDIVCVGDPLPLFTPSVASQHDTGDRTFGDRDVRRLAELLAGQVRNSAPPSTWPTILESARQLLEQSEE